MTVKARLTDEHQKSKRLLGLGAALVLWASSAHAVVFQFVYDSVSDSSIVAADVVGTGTLSYDGPAVAGSFLLSDLTGVSFSATFTGSTGMTTFSGPPFDPADLSLIGISVTDVGGGVFEAVFTGDSASTGGSLDIDDIPDALLTHQPAALLGNVTGPRLYFAGDDATGLDAFGDYLGTTVPVSAPAAILLLLTGFAALGFARRKQV